MNRDAAIGATVRISIPLQFEFVESDPSNSVSVVINYCAVLVHYTDSEWNLDLY